MNKNLLKMLMVVSITVWAGISLADISSGDLSSNPHFKRNIDGSWTMPGYKPNALNHAKFHHHASASQMLDLRITVPLSNQAELDAFLKDVNDPNSPNYHHYLTSQQFNQQFKVSEAELNTLKEYFISEGFSINKVSPNGTVIYVSGSVRAAELAFGFHINHYVNNKDGSMFYAPDADPTVSVEMVGRFNGILGFDNLPHFIPHLNQVSANPVPIILSSQNTATAQVSKPNFGTGPGGYLAPSDVTKAYNMNAIPTNYPSSIQNVALFELDGYLQSDIANYEAYFHLPNNNSVMLQNVLIDGYNGLDSYDGGNAEVTLDIEELIGIAPWSINKIYVYEATNTVQGWKDEWAKIANDDTSKIVSCSWGEAEYYSPLVSSDNQVFQQMAAQGQKVFVASGDCGAYADCSTKTLSADEPAAQPNVTAVGISALVTNSDGTYKSESASIDSGGGISKFNAIPSYQQPMAALATTASLVSKTMRNVPDVALTADSSTAYAFYISMAPNSAGWYGFWGSSIAAPTWAAFLAIVDQGRVQEKQSPVGFLNPVLYQLANSSKYATDFHDITSGNNQYYPAQTGLDDSTGLGSFNGANLYNDLVAPSQAIIPSVPAGLVALEGTNEITLSWNLSAGATSYNVKRATVSGGAYTTIGTASNTSYVDSSAVVGTTYYYVVSAVNTVGQTANSAQVSAVALPAVPTEPTLKSAIPGNGAVTFSWNAVLGASSYEVFRSTVSGSQWVVLASGLAGLSYVDSTAQNGTTYYYTVAAVNAGGTSPYINQYMVTLAPSAPMALNAVPGNSQAVLTWGLSSGAVSYNVKRATTSGGPYTTISTSGAVTVATYTDKTVTNTQTYFYVISAVNTGGEGANSSQVSVTPNNLVPATPTGLAAVGGNLQVSLSWNAVSGATSYIVEKSTVSNASFVPIATVTSPNYTDLAVSNGYSYYYEVIAANSHGDSPNTAEVYANPAGVPLPSTTVTAVAGNGVAIVSFSGGNANGSVIIKYTVTSSPGGMIATGTASPITVAGLTNGISYTFTEKATNGVGTGNASSPSNSVIPQAPAPLPPTGLSGLGGNAKVTLNWTASSGATSYNIKKGNSLGVYTKIASVTGSTTYADTMVTNWTTYFYVVSAVNSSGAESPNSSMVEVVPYSPLSAPVVTAVSGPGTVNLTWNAIAGTEDYYVYRSTSASGPFYSIGYSTSNAYMDAAVVSGSTYYYEVAAYELINGTGFFSQYSTPLKAIPLSLAPTGFLATAGNTQVSLSWNVSNGAISYNVKRATSSSGAYTTIASNVTVTSFTNTGLSNGTTYYYVVSAVNAGGEGPNSVQVNATPAVPAPVAAVTNLKASAITYEGGPAIVLQWTQSSSTSITSNNIYYSISSGSFVKLASVNATTSVIIYGINPTVTYNFKITAVNNKGIESSASGVVTIK